MAICPNVLLVIEDDQEMLDLNVRILEQSGYLTVPAHNLKTARGVLQGLHPQAVLLDVGLPDGSGLDFCRELRDPASELGALNPGLIHIPILFVTARGSPEEVAAGFAAGGDDYISKPFFIDRLTTSVENLIQRTS